VGRFLLLLLRRQSKELSPPSKLGRGATLPRGFLILPLYRVKGRVTRIQLYRSQGWVNRFIFIKYCIFFVACLGLGLHCALFKCVEESDVRVSIVSSSQWSPHVISWFLKNNYSSCFQILCSPKSNLLFDDEELLLTFERRHLLAFHLSWFLFQWHPVTTTTTTTTSKGWKQGSTQVFVGIGLWQDYLDILQQQVWPSWLLTTSWPCSEFGKEAQGIHKGNMLQ
jgi:hypothetical protein